MELFVVKLSQTGPTRTAKATPPAPHGCCDPTMWPATDMQSVSSYSAGWPPREKKKMMMMVPSISSEDGTCWCCPCQGGSYMPCFGAVCPVSSMLCYTWASHVPGRFAITVMSPLPPQWLRCDMMACAVQVRRPAGRWACVCRRASMRPGVD